MAYPVQLLRQWAGGPEIDNPESFVAEDAEEAIEGRALLPDSARIVRTIPSSVSPWRNVATVDTAAGQSATGRCSGADNQRSTA
jgi:hypothetical protein